ncbi:MAG: glycosyltransferase family 4 protein [Gemmatimonadaceae bacterium]
MTDTLRVLFIAHAYPRFAGDPVGSFIHNLAIALRGEGIEVVVVAPSAPSLKAHEVIDGVEIHRYRYAPRRLETLAYTGTMSSQVGAGLRGKLAMLGLLASSLVANRRIARRVGARVVHAHWWFPGGLTARWLRTLAGIPYLITLHGSDLRLALGSPLGARLFRAVASRASAITAVSSWLARGAADIGAGPSPIVAPMPVLTELFFPDQTREPGRLLFVGKLSAQKGLDRLLRAMAAMTERPTLTVVGAGRVDDAAVRALARDLGLDDRIEWLPILPQSELAVQYRRAAIHVIPALDEGLGLTAVEALLSETPVIAFDSGGMPDVVVHGHTGLLVPRGDEAHLARALDELLRDGSRRAAMGRAGRSHALSVFGARAVARRYAALYRSAAGAPPLHMDDRES